MLSSCIQSECAEHKFHIGENFSSPHNEKLDGLELQESLKNLGTIQNAGPNSLILSVTF